MHFNLIRIIIALMLATGCRAEEPQQAESGPAEKPPLNQDTGPKLERSDVQAAYDRARASMLSEKQVHMDVLWGLNQLRLDDPELDAFAAAVKGDVHQPHYIPGVFPDLPRLDLPERPGRGTGRFFTFVQAPFGRPVARALSFLNAYIAEENSGYVLTHQFFCLVWAEQAGLPISDAMKNRRQELWQKIYAEQCAAQTVDSIDLYMERTAIVLMYDNGEKELDQKAVDRWVRTIIEMQRPDGAWPLSQTPVEYDGGKTVLNSPRSHTTVLAMMALDAYLNPNR